MAHQNTGSTAGDMKTLIFGRDWSETPLGAIGKWPQSLRTAVHICLASDSPACICWGNDLVCLYNDAWKDLLGIDPSLLGHPAREILEGDKQAFEPYVEEVLATGEDRRIPAYSLSLDNDERKAFNISFSPIFDEDETVNGVYIILKERKRYDSKPDVQLKQMDSEYYDFFENAPIGLHWLGPEGTILEVNQTELDMLGYSREEYVGRNITEFYVKDALIEEVMKRIKKGEEVHNIEAQMIHKNGSVREVLLSSNGFRKNGKFIHTRCFTRDITDSKFWKRRMEESEDRYRTLIENFPKGAVGLFDEDLRYTAFGGELLSRIGIIPEDRIGNRITDVYPKEVVDPAKPYFKAAFEGKANSFDVELHDRQLHCQTLPIENSEGDIISGMLVVQDVTERWQAQQELRESEAKFRMLAENLNEIIWMASEDGEEFFYINPAFEKIWGIDRERLYDEPMYFMDAVHPDDRDRVQERFAGLREQEYDDEYRIIRPDGEIRWLHAQGSIVHDKEGGMTRIIGTARDITDRKEAQLQLKAINETLEERVEERTQTLRSYQKKLRSLTSKLNKAEEQEQQRLASELHDSVGQMLTVAKMKVVELSQHPAPDLEELKKIIDDIFKYTQNLMVELTPPPALNKEDVTEVLLWTIDKMKKKGLDITIEDDGQLKPVDEEFRSILHQSVRELLRNVKKHAGTREARVKMTREKGRVKVMVEDKGKGFDMKESQSIPTEAGRFGLFNIKERMDWHGGFFDMYSEPGRGTKAVLSVPVKEKKRPKKISPEDPERRIPAAAKGQGQQQQKVTVLLVDDHEMVRRGLRQLIEEQHDLTVMGEASHGQEAVELARELSPDIIVMDVNMPVMDGIEATQKIKREMPGVRIIGLSFHKSREVIENMRSAGASAYLTKSEAFESLIMAIRAESNGSSG
ncbi:PAS domain S-box-containing protein [Fodinibius roseus]|uniref:histidine kinase n=1 Tax=Fodinibius roseus TaxID=1194090 RepID=A0A1M5GQR4_9BACT|nr:PAS domain S-box protein [Fodinibius roseus]SHG06105.1 PAS domain S-box-containing protein [Fodinibius roseus]